jgi:hypothetical protein
MSIPFMFLLFLDHKQRNKRQISCDMHILKKGKMDRAQYSYALAWRPKSPYYGFPPGHITAQYISQHQIYHTIHRAAACPAGWCQPPHLSLPTPLADAAALRVSPSGGSPSLGFALTPKSPHFIVCPSRSELLSGSNPEASCVDDLGAMHSRAGGAHYGV